jgi:hypothetical protein
MTKKTVRKGDIGYVDDDGKVYGISKRELGIKGAGGDKQASEGLKKMKNRVFIYPDKILREKKSTGGLIKGKPKLAKKGWK